MELGERFSGKALYATSWYEIFAAYTFGADAKMIVAIYKHHHFGLKENGIPQYRGIS